MGTFASFHRGAGSSRMVKVQTRRLRSSGLMVFNHSLPSHPHLAALARLPPSSPLLWLLPPSALTPFGPQPLSGPG